MLASMTAFARHATQQAWGHAIWEVRSVNHRYLDLSFKIPENFREWEIKWRNLSGTFIQRGKVECYLTFVPSQQASAELEINTPLIEQILKNCKTVTAYPDVSPTIKALDLLRWPGALVMQTRDLSFLEQPLTELLQKTLEKLVVMRQQEGVQLVQFLEVKLHQAIEQIAIVKTQLPHCLHAQRQKLTQKLHEVQATLDTGRLEQELVLYAQRIDVEEEIVRLIAHTQEIQRILKEKGASGRRLDFLMQEMNREANTLGAKAPDKIIAQVAIELKVLIEQMREQIQNVE